MNTVWTLTDFVSERQVELPDSGKKYTVRFANMPAMITAARELAELFEQWEIQHVAYVEVSRDAFLFDPKTGKLTFQDAKKVVGKGMELTEEQRIGFYSAPELVLGETVMTTEAQNWTLAMLLFDLCYHGGHPLCGAESFSQKFLCPEEEYLWYAANGIFNMEENTCKNRPIHGLQGYLMRFWNFYPQVLRDAFTETFLDGKEERARRYSPKKWKQVLNEMLDAMPCSCGYSQFIHTYTITKNGNFACPKCGKIFYTMACGDRRLYLRNETQIYRYQLDPDDVDNRDAVAVVVESRQRAGVFGIRNNTDEIWTAAFPKDSIREVAKGQVAPIWPGLSITLPGGDVWQIKQQETEKTNE